MSDNKSAQRSPKRSWNNSNNARLTLSNGERERKKMTTSVGTALRRLQQSHARDHHHAECANGFHAFNVRLNSPPASTTIIFCDLRLSARPLRHVPFPGTAALTPFRPRAQTRLRKESQYEEIILGSFSCFAVTVWAAEKSANDWAMNASIIEACSCPMFCQCYFNTSPAGHSGHGDHAAANTSAGSITPTRSITATRAR